MQEELRAAQSAAFAAAQDLTRIRNEITALDLQKQGNSIRLEKLSAEKIQLEEERARLESRLQEFTASVEVEKLNAQPSAARSSSGKTGCANCRLNCKLPPPSRINFCSTRPKNARA